MEEVNNTNTTTKPEEQKVSSELKVTVKPVVEEPITEQVAKIEKEIEIEDKAKIEEITKTYENKFIEMQKQFEAKLDEAVKKKVEELNGRKGLADVPQQNPYVASQPAPQVQEKIDHTYIQKIQEGSQVDREMATAFLNSIRK